MTAVACFTDNKYAYLGTDGATYEARSHTLHGHMAKVLMYEPARLALAITGRWAPLQLRDAIESEDAIDGDAQANVLAAVPAALRALWSAPTYEQQVAVELGINSGAVFAAFYDTAARDPRLMWVHTEGYPGEPDSLAWTWRDTPGHIMPALSEDEQARIFPQGHCVWPRREMGQILRAQRHATDPCNVGGHCGFYRVGPGGIDYDEMLQFPEAIGEKLDASRPGRFIPSKLDKRAR